ncbi:MAG TPA: SpoIID/LytB domain-containing protein [Pseudonocardia sp.]|nr:SpoIID/LytB domain-containing protein [Pseudonocardia sp.]
MRAFPLPRGARAAIAVLLALAACTSSAPDPGGPATVATPSEPGASATGSEGTPGSTPMPTTDQDELRVSARRVLIRPPAGGSFRVRGAYPWTASRCVRPDRPKLAAHYPGALAVRTGDDGTLTVTVTLGFQEYLEGIAEVPPTWPMAALEAQVIAARSYVLSRTGFAGEQGERLDTPICGTSACQVYGGIPHPRPPGLRRWYRAVRATRGKVLLSGGRPADTVYFSTSNGRTYGNDEVFGGSPLPYLRPVPERHDAASPLARWRVDLPLGDLATVLRAAGSWPAQAPIASAAIGDSGVQLSGGGERRTIGAGDLRDAVNTWAPCLLPGRYPSGGLPTTIPSGWFSLSSNPRGLTITGRGWGHGVGMVQWGAYGKASRGWSTARILGFYYGGLAPRPYPEPGTMQVVVATGLRSLTVVPSGPGARLGDRTLGEAPLRVSGGDRVTVSAAARWAGRRPASRRRSRAWNRPPPAAVWCTWAITRGHTPGASRRSPC